jgi:hypothetical protein
MPSNKEGVERMLRVDGKWLRQLDVRDISEKIHPAETVGFMVLSLRENFFI